MIWERMNLMNRKFILFIVEGTNDKREIDALLHTSYFAEYREKYEPQFWPKGGDLTASVGVTVKNVQQKLNDIVMDFRRNGVPFSNIKVQDIQEVVQIVDLDGTFIPLENIIRGDSSKFLYTDENIITANVDGARGRNKKKAEILNKLVEIQQIGNIPYSAYFVSCNMDHLLFGKRALSPKDKNTFAFQFQIMCQEDPEKLRESVFKPGIATKEDYTNSWNTIKNGCQSLQRHTNINLFFGSDSKYAK